MAKRLHQSDEISDAEVLLAFLTRKAEKQRQILIGLRERESYANTLNLLAQQGKLLLLADDKIIDKLRSDFYHKYNGWLLVRQRVNHEPEGDESSGKPPMIILRVLYADMGARFYLGPYDVLVPREQDRVVGDCGIGSYEERDAPLNGTQFDDDFDCDTPLCEDAWKQRFATFNVTDQLWYANEKSVIVKNQ